jgi:hypothetical protein
MALTPAATMAVDVERFLMPGPLIQGHAKFEAECARCHEAFRKGVQRTLCLNCHKDIAADVAAARGFHGRSKDVKEAECKRCHTDHKGRGVDIVRLDREIFDHAITDFPLEGAHKKVACTQCHAAKAKYRDAPSTCIGCHKAHDRHRGRLGEACADCHGQQTWRNARFNHDATKFPLKGKHREVPCASCHPGERYKNTPTECFSCHRLNDVHGGRYGNKCGTCHVPDAWKRIVFDHDKTTFPLQGKHQKVRCETCHTNRLYETKLGTACYGCHKNDDEHKGRYGQKCETCHVPEAWKRAVFDHDKTKFPLRGKHQKVRCDTCHRGSLYQAKLGTTCHGCHAPDDVHRGQLGTRCERCHNENGWRAKVFFDHDLTRFPLIGLHAVVPCEQCHPTAAYKNTPLDCFSCHRRHDKHERRLGTRCALCHNPNGWALWRFDHDTQTKFVLDGAHRGLACQACHQKPVETDVRVSTRCVACHQADDVHRGGFGPRCEQCHTTRSFREPVIKR